MPTPYTTQTGPTSNTKTGPQTSSTPAGQKPPSGPSAERRAAMAGLGMAKDMAKRKAEIEADDMAPGGEANAQAAHAVDLVASTAGEMNLAAKVGRKGRV